MLPNPLLFLGVPVKFDPRRCSHGMLVSGTASGELHFWDTATGALIFGAKAQHPSNAGISALSCSEGGTVDSEDAGGGGNTIACSGAAAAAEIANLALYTACEEGYVKTWKLGTNRALEN